MPDPFSPNYRIARDRFREAATRLDARLETFAVDARGPAGEDLTIDVALIGDPHARSAVVVASGLHGIEGFFGAAIQLAWMAVLEDDRTLPHSSAIVLVHAINPFGFAWRRRCDEQNIDLNRNFLRPGEPYEGAPQGYRELHGLLNPSSPPSRLEPFRLKAAWNIWRRGMTALKSAVAVGQYEYGSGLFFGGRGPAPSTRLIQEKFQLWLGGAKDIVQIDLHSGLGGFGRYKLLLVEPTDSPLLSWYRQNFGDGVVEPVTGGIAYPARGTMGKWLTDDCTEKGYRFRYLNAEFGTHPIVRVLGALRAENGAHHYCEAGHPAYERAKKELLECFCPRSTAWRQTVIAAGIRILRAAVVAAADMDS